MIKLKSPLGNDVQVSDQLYVFVRDEVVTGTEWKVDQVFRILEELVVKFAPRNKQLLEKRIEVQQKIDKYYLEKRNEGWRPTKESEGQDAEDFEKFLLEIKFIKPQNPITFQVPTPELDEEMRQNGPELVTPVTNASMAVGGANARWVSLYDAYFLSDIHSELDKETRRSDRLEMVVQETNEFLDQHVVSWENNVKFGDIVAYEVRQDGAGKYQLIGLTSWGTETRLSEPEKFVGFNRSGGNGLNEFFLVDNGLRLQFQLYDGGMVDPENRQFKDLIVESAVTNIIDFEDAVSVVDVNDMVEGMRNYLGLIRGDLNAFGSRGHLKAINPDKFLVDVDGQMVQLKATSLMSVRNVSLHLYTDVVQINGEDIPERMLGVLLTTLIATLHDKGSVGGDEGTGSSPRYPNSRKGYVYQVTPKLQAAEEVSEQVRFFSDVEKALGVPERTLLIGIMNEEFGMTLQLAESLEMTDGRAFFINTGFLDRTGSQIRAQMYAGPVNLRDDLTQEKYNISYELHNVDIGIQTGVHKEGKIGKGMQVRNRAMAEMMQKKIDHPRTGGNTAWVPAPNPSALHAMHYHMVDVDLVQRVMEDSPALNIPQTSLVSFPLLDHTKIADKDVRDNLVLRYVHSMFAYAEPWVRRGIGCSGVRNFDGIEEMKDRATERIDGVVLANWKLHGVIGEQDIEAALLKLVRAHNDAVTTTAEDGPIGGPEHDRESVLAHPAIASVLQVIAEALDSPSGYVEPSLFRNRKLNKSTMANP